MKDKYKITEEEINQAILHSPYSLADSPASVGIKAKQIKKYFYEFIRFLANKINVHLEELGKTLENYDELSCAVDLIPDLQEKDIELGKAIPNLIGAHNNSGVAHNDIREKISTDIGTHNTSGGAHSDIRELIKSAKESAENAYNLARGKSKIHPMHDYGEFIYYVKTKPEEYNVGDMFIFDNKNAPDFMLFEKNIQFVSGEDDVEISGEYLPNDFEFTPGSRVVINGMRFVIQESGYDISKLATDEELSALNEELTELIIALGERVTEVNDVLDFKENSFEKKENTQSEITLENHTEYSLGLITELSIALPEETEELDSIINFRAGATAPSFDAPSELVFSGDDTSGGRFYPITHRIYEINIKEVMGILSARVGATDFEVIE
ncbi:MAG: hypothetical protein IJD42_07745 [Clostridia bacterium]|nr:hypothetical protein [Clostridia bacterium]